MYNIYKNIEYNRKEKTMKIILIRHSEPDYSFINDDMCCQWSNLAPLTKKGIEIAEITRNDERLKTGKVLASPYTRALQTAHILFPDREITVEPMLHEWMPDETFQVKAKNVYLQNKKYKESLGKHQSEEDTWEEKESMIKRINEVINKYKELGEEKIIIVAHERIINMALDNYQKIPFCGICEIER
jgi:broad specificity phosphatase PhoE